MYGIQLLYTCPTLCDPMDSSLPGSSVHGILQEKNTGMGWHFLLLGIFLTQGSKDLPPAFQADSLLSETLGKPQNTEEPKHN